MQYFNDKKVFFFSLQKDKIFNTKLKKLLAKDDLVYSAFIVCWQ